MTFMQFLKSHKVSPRCQESAGYHGNPVQHKKIFSNIITSYHCLTCFGEIRFITDAASLTQKVHLLTEK